MQASELKCPATDLKMVDFKIYLNGNLLVTNFKPTVVVNSFSSNLGDVKDYDIIHADKGVLLRLYWLNDERRLSTNKNVDAYQSRWESTKTFGERFDAIVTDEELKNLDRTNAYFLFMRCGTDGDTVLFSATSPLGTDKLYFTNTTPFQTKDSLSLDTTSQLNTAMTKCDYQTYNGLLGRHKKTNALLLFCSDKETFNRHFSSCLFRYFQAVRDGKQHDDEHVEHVLYTRTFPTILRLYMQRHKQKVFVTLDPRVHYLLKKLHGRYIAMRSEGQPYVITIDDVRECFFSELDIYSQIKLVLMFPSF
jgi:hypothetical protein